MAKGRKTGGRKPGSLNKATLEIKELLGRLCTDEAQEQDWRKWLNHKDPHIAFGAFKLAQSYLHGKPIQPLVGVEEAAPININVSAIPKHRVPAEASREP